MNCILDYGACGLRYCPIGKGFIKNQPLFKEINCGLNICRAVGFHVNGPEAYPSGGGGVGSGGGCCENIWTTPFKLSHIIS